MGRGGEMKEGEKDVLCGMPNERYTIMDLQLRCGVCALALYAAYWLCTPPPENSKRKINILFDVG